MPSSRAICLIVATLPPKIDPDLRRGGRGSGQPDGWSFRWGELLARLDALDDPDLIRRRAGGDTRDGGGAQVDVQ
jgi:hypothetical protein